MVVFSEGASASALGVATFQTALISALLLSGLLCDRFGIGVEEKNILRHGALLAHCSPLSPPFLSCRHSGTQPRLSCSLSSPFWQGYSLAGSLRGMLKSPRQRAPCWCPLHGTSSSAFVSGRGAGDTYRIRPCHHPVTRYMVDVSRWSAGSAVHRANGDSGERLRTIDAGRSVNSRTTAWLSAN